MLCSSAFGPSFLYTIFLGVIPTLLCLMWEYKQVIGVKHFLQARPLLTQALDKQDFAEIVDPRLEKNYVEHEVFRMIEAAAACVRHLAAKRPRMSQVYINHLNLDSLPTQSSSAMTYLNNVFLYISTFLGSESSRFYAWVLRSNQWSKTWTKWNFWLQTTICRDQIVSADGIWKSRL